MSGALKERVLALLDGPLSRGQLKRAAAELDAEPDLRQAVLDEAQRRRVDLPDDAIAWPGKKLLRRARDREDQAHARSNPIARDESFTCVHCGLDVPAHGRTARDHCPRCLRSQHVDVVPGDRAAGCGGLLDPVHAEGAGDRWRLHYRCRRCGAEKVNRAILDGELPDAWADVVRLASGQGPP